MKLCAICVLNANFLENQAPSESSNLIWMTLMVIGSDYFKLPYLDSGNML